jgi:hypothetical protein
LTEETGLQPEPSDANGQHTQAHAVAPLTVFVVELVMFAPASESVPGSPEPVSPAVSCQGVGPSSKVGVWANAERSTVPDTQYVFDESEDEGAPPLTVYVHHVEMLKIVSSVPLQAASPPESLPPSEVPPDESGPESPLEAPDELLPELPELPLEDPPDELPEEELVPELELLLVPLLEPPVLLPLAPLLDPPVASVPPPSSPPGDDPPDDEPQPAATPRPVAKAAEKKMVRRVDFMREVPLW